MPTLLTPFCGSCPVHLHYQMRLPFAAATLASTTAVQTAPQLNSAISDFLAAKEARARRPVYLRCCKVFLARLLLQFPVRTVDSFQPSELEAWVDSLVSSPVSRNSYLAILSAFFGWCERRAWITRNPCTRIERSTIEKKAPQTLTVDQCAALFAWARTSYPRYVGPLAVLLFGAVRPFECARLRDEDFSLDAGELRISAGVSKVRQRRLVKLSPNCVAWLRAYPRSPFQMGPASRGVMVHRFRDALGLDRWPMDVLRHTGATMLLARTGNAAQVALSLGHGADVLLSHYADQLSVSESDCKRFWSLAP